MRKVILSTLLMMLFYACMEQREQYDYYSLSKQLTPSGKYAIYEYARYGPMAFSSDIVGTELFGANEDFVEGCGKRINGRIGEWLSDDTLLVYNFRTDQERPMDTLPIKTEYEKLGDLVVKTVYYGLNAGGRDKRLFDSVFTSSDSIVIRVVGSDNKKQDLRFPLGATRIKTQADTISYIEIEQVHKSMDFVRKNEDGTYTAGLPEIGISTYDLTPTKKLSTQGLSKRKIFWE